MPFLYFKLFCTLSIFNVVHTSKKNKKHSNTEIITLAYIIKIVETDCIYLNNIILLMELNKLYPF